MQEVESSSTSFPAVVFPTLKGQNTQHQIFAAGKAKGLRSQVLQHCCVFP